MDERQGFLVEFAELVNRHITRWRERRADTSPSNRPGRLLHWLTPNGGTVLLIVVVVLTQRVWAGSLLSPTATGPSATTINYQGRLADSGGVPLDGTYGMTFALWDASTEGNLVWGPESHAAVPVSDGLFSVGLGSQTAGGIPTSTWNGDRYLEISVGGETLNPRELIRSVPIAGMALTVPDGAISSRKVKLDSGLITPTDSFDLTSSWQLIPGMSFTLSPDTDQTYIFYLVVEMVDYGSTEGYGMARLYVDGYAAGSAAFMHWDADLATVAQLYRVDLQAGAHTFEVKASSSEGGGSIYKSATSLAWFAVSQ